jgi:predicted transcriptional regulator
MVEASCRDDDDLAKAVQHMEKLKVRRLPVINKSKSLKRFGALALARVTGAEQTRSAL